GLLARLDHQPVQVRIGGKDRHLLRRPRKYDFIRIRTEVNLATHERVHLWTTFALMNESDAARQHATIGKLSTDTDQRGHPGLDLMSIGTPFNPDIVEGHRQLLSPVHAQANAFI